MEQFFPLPESARAHLDRIVPAVLGQLNDALPQRDVELFRIRLERHFFHLYQGLEEAYGEHPAFVGMLTQLVERMASHYVERSAELKLHDLSRMAWPDWFQHESMLGYVAYADRFAGSLSGVHEKLDYLQEMGVTYLHLLPFLQHREGENDGGYAVQSYRSVEPRLGTMADLEALAGAMRSRGMSLCCDLVLNHVADSHEWAVAARAGESKYRRFFHVHADRAIPDAYEESLPQIFPATDPGSFTQVADLGWVWTTFHGYQWDLNWSNPEVFIEIADTILWLANRGVDVFRLDAIAFLWKRLGTACQNQPEVHALTRALRAVVRTTAPAVAFKAEAIVGPDDLIHYLGTDRHHGMVSDLAYHNSLMVQYWSSMAARDARVMTAAMQRMPPRPGNTAWATYLRCHDDIGWAVSDEDAASVGWEGAAHRSFLGDFYDGSFPDTHARGVDFQTRSGAPDRRTSGTTASLSGLERALEEADPVAVTLAIERILLGHALIMTWGGVPVIYMGDEIGLTNDYRYRDDPEKASDNRWLHRPRMAWVRAQERHTQGRPEQRIFEGLARLSRARKSCPHLHARWPTETLTSGVDSVFAHVRRHPTGNLLALYNFSERPQTVPEAVLAEAQLEAPTDHISGEPVVLVAGGVQIAPYGRLWLV